MASSMFERYGGFANVSKVVMAFYDKALDSDVIGDYFVNVDMPALIDHQTKFISSVMGGPASYSNDQLQRIHAHLSITVEALDEMIALLEETLNEFELDPADVSEIVDQLRAKSGFIITA